MKQYEAVLFDFDGVLVDSEPIHHQCWQEILQPFGIELDWDTYRDNCIGITDRTMLEFLCSRISPPLDIDLLWPEYPRKKLMFRERMLALDPIKPEVVELIHSLRSDFKVAVVTSSGQTEVEPLLAKAHLLGVLSTVVYGNDVTRHKPFPDPYLLAMERLGVATAFAIEDSQAGLASAAAAGLDLIAVKDQAEMVGQVREFLAAAKADS
jgi:beta-phosphoglucomutase